MKKFYLFEVSTGDSKISGKAAYEFNTLNEAVANFHSKMGVAMKSDLYTREQLIVIDENNIIYKQEVFERQIEPEVPEETEEVTE